MGPVKKLTHGYRSVVGLNMRLAELIDVMMELLLPVADRDQDEVEAVLARYRADVSEPLRWRSGD
jgi:hypothetical protein